MRGWPLAACLLAACASPARDVTPTASAGAPAGERTPPVTVGRASCNSGPYTVWLDFDGASLVHAASDDATATPIASLLASSSVAFPAFDGAVAAPRVTRQQAIDAVVDRVRTRLAGYAVDVTTGRPAAPPYAVVLVGGTHADVGAPAGEGGLAVEDCDNLYDRDVSFAFAGEYTPARGGVVALADTVLHEVGHSFGLLHTVSPSDLMYSVAAPMLTLPSLFTLGFGAGDYSPFAAGVATPVARPCAGSDPVDNAALLACNAGTRARSGDVTPPTLAWVAPTLDAGSEVGAPLAVAFTASDDTAVTRLEVYKNLELVAVLAAPPYDAVIDATPGEQVFVTVEAIDAAANRATLTREFTVAAAADMATRGDLAGPRTMTRARGCDYGGSDGSDGVMLVVVMLAGVATTSRRRWRRARPTRRR